MINTKRLTILFVLFTSIILLSSYMLLRVVNLMADIEPSPISGQLAIYSCQKPESVTLRICESESQDNCQTSNAVWLSDSNADRTWIYNFKFDKRNLSYLSAATVTINSATQGYAINKNLSEYQNFDSVLNLKQETCICPYHAMAYIQEQIHEGTVTYLQTMNENPIYGFANDKQIFNLGDKAKTMFVGGINDYKTNQYNFINPLSYGRDGSASVKVYYDKSRYQVVKQKCQSFGSVKSCPGLTDSWQVNANKTPDPDIIHGLRTTCDVDVKYGWIMKQVTPTPAPTKTITQRQDELLARREGFGKDVTGGYGGKVIIVTNSSDDEKNSSQGSLRWAVNQGENVIITFNPKKINASKPIQLKNDISLKSNTTIDGRGVEVVITKYGLVFNKKSNIIVTNIILADGLKDTDADNECSKSEDGISIKNKSHDIWLDHVSASSYCDGLLDITNGSYNITVSWSRFFSHSKAILIGNTNGSSGQREDPNITVTFHHNSIGNLVQRLPRVRFGYVDLYNNYIHNWVYDGATTCSNKSRVLIEKNIFQAGPNKNYSKQATSNRGGDDPETGSCRIIDNLALNGAKITSFDPDKVTNRPYQPLSLEPVTEALMQKVSAQSGAQPASYYP